MWLPVTVWSCLSVLNVVSGDRKRSNALYILSRPFWKFKHSSRTLLTFVTPYIDPMTIVPSRSRHKCSGEKTAQNWPITIAVGYVDLTLRYISREVHARLT